MLRLTLLSLLLFTFTFSPVQASLPIGAQIEDFTTPPWTDLARVHATWIKVQAFAENQPGILHYHPLAELLAFIRIAHAKGYKVLVSTEGYRSDPLGHLSAYTAFLGALGSADAIEVWNEENNPNEFNGSPQVYATVERAAIRAIPAGVTTIVGALQPQPTEATWAQVIRGLPGSCVGIHYEDFPFHSISQRRADISAFYGARALCFTEVGVLAGKGYSGLSGNFFWATDTDRAAQASTLKAITRSFSGRLLILFNVGFTTHGADPMDGYNLIAPDGSCGYC